MNQQHELTTTLTSDAMASLLPQLITILQESIDGEGKEINNGVMRIRVPFYVAGSTSKVTGFDKKVMWPSSTLDAIIQEGNAQVAAKRQPLTVYPRHSHALSGAHLPCGDVVQLERNGRLGMATIEVAPTSIGKDVQILARTGKLNAVSLRSRNGDHVLADAMLDNEPVLVCEKLGMAGIDFAPDDPAQETFGIEILNENAVAVPVEVETEPKTSKEGSTMPDPTPLTLESLRRDQAALVAEIEKPLRNELEQAKATIATLTQENGKLKASADAAELDEFVSQMAKRTSDPVKFREVFKALCQEKNITNVASATPHVVPLLLGALDAATAAPAQPAAPAKSVETMLQELFPRKEGTGATAPAATGTAPEGEALTQEQTSARASARTVGGLLLPDDGGAF